MRAITTQHIRKHGFPDAASFKQAFNLPTLKCADMRERQSRFMRENSPTAGGHSPEAVRKMRANRKGKGVGVAGKYERTPEIRRKIAEGVVRAWESGKRGRGKYVYARLPGKKVWVRSSWEERVVLVLDRHPCVVTYDVEPFQITYLWDGCEHRYTPDFLVVLEGGIRELWEVKPEELLDESRNAAKVKALNAFVVREGMNSRLVTLRDIEGMEMQVGLREWKGPGAPWVRLDDPDYRPTVEELQAMAGVSTLSSSRSSG